MPCKAEAMLHKCAKECVCVCASVCGEGQWTQCIHTEAGQGLESSLEADLFQAKVAVPEQTTPEEHPVKTGAVVHDDHAALSRNEAIPCDHHLHPKHQLQQRLPRRERECEQRTDGKRSYKREKNNNPLFVAFLTLSRLNSALFYSVSKNKSKWEVYMKLTEYKLSVS